MRQKKKQSKKVYLLCSALTMALVMFFVPQKGKNVEAKSTTKSSLIPIYVNGTQEAPKYSLSKDKEIINFEWKCPQTATYTIKTIGTKVDTCGYLFERSGKPIIEGQEGGGDGENFGVTRKFEGGKSYQIAITSYNKKTTKKYGNFQMYINMQGAPSKYQYKSSEVKTKVYTKKYDETYEKDMKLCGDYDGEIKLKDIAKLVPAWEYWKVMPYGALPAEMLENYLANTGTEYTLSITRMEEAVSYTSGENDLTNKLNDLAKYAFYAVADNTTMSMYALDSSVVDAAKGRPILESRGAVAGLLPYNTAAQFCISLGSYRTYLDNIKVTRKGVDMKATFNYNIIDVYDFTGNDFLGVEDLMYSGKAMPYKVKGRLAMTAKWKLASKPLDLTWKVGTEY